MENKIETLNNLLNGLIGECVMLDHKHNPEGELLHEQAVVGKCVGDRLNYFTAHDSSFISENNWLGNIAKVTYGQEVLYADQEMLDETQGMLK